MNEVVSMFYYDPSTTLIHPRSIPGATAIDIGALNVITTGNIDANTHSNLTLTSLATGFSIAGGTIPKTLTVDIDASISGLVPYTGATGAVDLGSQTLTSGGLTTKGDANLYSNSTDANVKDINLYKSRGTYASPSVITTGDYLGEIVGHGHDGTNYIRSSSIRFKSTGTVGVNRVPSVIEFYTSTNASPSVETYRGEINALGAFEWFGQYTLYNNPFVSVRYNLAASSADGVFLQNTTASLVGTPVQISPRIRERGSAWNTTSSASETVDCIQELLPVSGTSVSGTYRIGFSINGGAYSYPFQLRSNGNLSGISELSCSFVVCSTQLSNAGDPARFTLNVGSATASAQWSRNTADAYATAVINNLNAGSTGNITNFQWQSVNQVTIGRTGTVSISSAQAIANVSTDGLVLENTSPALVGTPVQMSERTRYSGRAWETTGGTSQSVDCISELLPVSGATASGTYRIGFSINGGAYSYPFTFTSKGLLEATTIHASDTIRITSGSGEINALTTPNHGRFVIGSATLSNRIIRNMDDAYATFEINNIRASSTGNITNFQWQSVTRAFVDRFGVFASYGNDLPHTVKKAASANVRNSHDAEATSTSASYVKVKTITLTYGLVGSARFLFDLKTSDSVGPTTAYGRIYRNGVALGTEQTDITGAYVTMSEDITQNWNPGDTVELWIHIDGTKTASVQNFRIAYDDSPSVAVAYAIA